MQYSVRENQHPVLIGVVSPTCNKKRYTAIILVYNTGKACSLIGVGLKKP